MAVVLTAFEVASAIEIIFKTVSTIRDISEKCKLLPECAHCLSNRSTAFEVQMKLLKQNQSNMIRFGDAILDLKKVLDLVRDYLIKLSKINGKGWMKRLLHHQSLIEEYKSLNQKLNTCRDDLQFQFIVDNTLQERIQHAYEDDLNGLIELSFEEQRVDFHAMKVLMTQMMTTLRGIQSQQKQSRRKGLAAPQPTPSRVMETAQYILDVSSTSPKTGNELHMELQKLRSKQLQKLYIDPNRISLGTKIGQGGFGDVYLGRYDDTNDVAVKVLRYDSHIVDEVAALEEVRVQHECDSKYVVQIFGHTRLVMDGRNTMIAAIMEHATCGSLADFLSAAATGKDGLIEKQDHLDTARIGVPGLLYMLQLIALGMEFLHSRCFIHRDLKPRNVLLDHELKPKLCDFGLAKEVVGERSSAHTMTGNVGTFYYMAPEMISMIYDGGADEDEDEEDEGTRRGNRVRYSYTVDVYSIGVIILESSQRLYGGYKRKKVPKSKALPADFPSNLTTIKNRCLLPTPRERYGRGSDDGTLLSEELSKLYSTDQAFADMSASLFKVAKSIAQPKKSKSGSDGSITETTASMTTTATSGTKATKKKKKKKKEKTKKKATRTSSSSPKSNGNGNHVSTSATATPTTSTDHKLVTDPSSNETGDEIQTSSPPAASVDDSSPASIQDIEAQKQHDDDAAAKAKKKKRFYCISVFVLVVLGAIVVAVVVSIQPVEETGTTQSNPTPPPPPTPLPTTDAPITNVTPPPPTPSPTAASTSTITNFTPPPPTPSPTAASTSTNVRDTAISLLSQYIPDVALSTTQEQALNWLLINDDGLTEAQDSYGLLERFVLAVLYYSTNGDGWNDKDLWLSNDSVCQWDGVSCETIVGDISRVHSIDRFNDNLSGKIPTELGTLTILTYLSMDDNDLTGTIPTQLGNLSALTMLDLYRNGLTGTIPTQLGNLSALTRLDLHYNDLSGTIPSSLIPFLESLDECRFYSNPNLSGIPSNC